MIGKENKLFHFLPVVFIASLILPLTTSFLYAREDFLPVQVKDISDRAYEPAIIKLLDGAKESIVVSMYTISLGTKERNPVRLLLEDLLEARQRDVEVTIYLNTCFRKGNKEPKRLIEDSIFKRLQDAGCAIHFMPPAKRLHDKLLIVDGRYVVEGSANWSISALRGNFESATLIDSPDLAKIKLIRLKTFLLTINPQPGQSHRARYIENLPENMDFPKVLLLDKKYFPRMLTKRDSRCMDLYLILFAYSRTMGKQEFFINVEDMGLSLGMPYSWSDSALRRQVIKSFTKLKNNYNLLRVRFFHGKDAWVELVDIPGDSFIISSKLIKPDSGKKLSMRLKFLLLAEALLETQGEDIHSISGRELARRFHVHHTTINDAFKELSEKEKEIE